MVKANIPGKTEEFMKVNGKRIICMEKESIYGQMAANMKVNFIITLNKATVNTLKQVAKNILVVG